MSAVDVAIKPIKKSFLKTFVFGSFKLLLGILLCLTPLTAILVLGWLMRFMRREMLKYWRHRSNHKAYTEKQYENMPNWLRSNDSNGFLASFFENIRLGLQAFFVFSIVTLPYGTLWALAWWAGWNNSFNKGYEQVQVGPLIAIAGAIYFIIIMIYMPLAHSHHAAVGRWSAFFQIRTITKLIFSNRIRCFLLIFAWTVLALPIFAIRGVPVFIENIIPDFFSRSPEEIQHFSGTLKFWATVYVFCSALFLWRMAARLYARGCMKLDKEYLAKWVDLQFTQLNITQEQGNKHSFISSSVFRYIVSGIFILLSGILWFVFSFQILLSQFLNHNWMVPASTHPVTLGYLALQVWYDTRP